MKVFAFLFITFLCLPRIDAQVDFGKTAADLLSSCTITKVAPGKMIDTGEIFSYLACASYIQGVLEGASWMATSQNPLSVCLDTGVSNYQLAEVVRKYGADHPEYAHWTAQRFVIQALRAAFPCPVPK